MAARILCLGNRYRPDDDDGPRVHDHLMAAGVPAGIEVVDGGLGGLALLRVFDGVERVVVVDTVAGFAAPGSVVTLAAAAVAALAEGVWGHDAGLPGLLRMLPLTAEGRVPVVVVVGVEGPADDGLIAHAAAVSVALARGEEP